MTMKRILIVDDDVAVTNYFMVFLMQTELFEPTVINDSREVESLLAETAFDVIMLDLDMPNVTGMDILKMMQSRGDGTPVIILTGVSDVDLAVQAMKHGAFDYLTKPVDDENLLDALNNAMEHGALHSTIEQLPADLSHEGLDNKAAFNHLPTENSAVIRLFHQSEALAKSDLGICIWGERGTGKRWLAGAIHSASDRAEKPFVAMDCTNLSGDEFSAALFGRAQDWSGKADEVGGALESAEGGTLFINNIEHMCLPVQLRFNAALQSREYYRDNSTQIRSHDVRFIVASSQDLTAPQFKETFSRDLLYHVMVHSLRIPSLRDRPDDIPLIAQRFVDEECRKTGKDLSGLSTEFLELLSRYRFPGNLQELRELIRGAVANTESGEVAADALSKYSRERLALGGVGSEFTPRPLSDVLLDQVRQTVAHCKGDRSQAAALLRIDLQELDRYLTEESTEPASGI